MLKGPGQRSQLSESVFSERKLVVMEVQRRVIVFWWINVSTVFRYDHQGNPAMTY